MCSRIFCKSHCRQEDMVEVLGVHIIGPASRIGSTKLLPSLRWKLPEEMLGTIHGHPTFSEVMYEACGMEWPSIHLSRVIIILSIRFSIVRTAVSLSSCPKIEPLGPVFPRNVTSYRYISFYYFRCTREIKLFLAPRHPAMNRFINEFLELLWNTLPIIQTKLLLISL